MTDNDEREKTIYLNAIFDSMAHMVALVNPDLQVELINQKGAALSGKTRETLSGLLCGDAFQCVNTTDHQVCGQQPECLKCPLRTKIDFTFRTKRPCHEEEGQLAVFQNGRKVILHLLISTTLIHIRHLPKVLISLVDITDKKMMESRIQHAQKMVAIGSLAGGIAHDFNNILFPIVGMSELLLEDFKADSPVRESLLSIHSAGKRGVALVKQILAFSCQDEHKTLPIRIQQVIKEAVNLCRATIPADIEITQTLRTDTGRVHADPTQIHQIAMNLITNAYHALETTGNQIDISVSQIRLKNDERTGTSLEPGDYVLFSVSDNGCGIPAAHLTKIFDLYFTTKEKDKGTGLGLAVAYGIVKKFNGDITVYSEPGKGTTFNVYLPVMEKTENPALPDTRENPPPGGHESILVVDDDPAIATLLKKIMERLGYTVTESVSSPEAWRLFSSDPAGFDLVITDMSMPHMTGAELAKRMLSVRPDTPIVICTGFSEKINDHIAREIGVKGFLMKPIVISQLARMVRYALETS